MADGKDKKEKGKAKKKFTFFSDLKAELKKIIWPDKQKLIRSSAAVFVIAIGFAILIWIVDSLVYGGLNLVGFHEENKLASAVKGQNPPITETVPVAPVTLPSAGK